MDIPEHKRFSLVRRAQAFAHASRGVWVFVRTTHSAWIQLAGFGLAILLGVYFRISYLDWMLLVIAAAMVLVAEAFNTAIEIDIDLTSPEYHPYARDTKDVAAGAVLLASVAALIICGGIFGHHLLALIR